MALSLARETPIKPKPRHSRESGNPVRFLPPEGQPLKEDKEERRVAPGTFLDSRLRGNDGVLANAPGFRLFAAREIVERT
jgi:hypothetical protein